MSFQAMRERIRRFSSLDRAEKSILLQAFLLLPLLSLGLRLMGFRRTQALLAQGVSREVASDKRTHASPERTARMVRAAGRHGIVKPTCLSESLVLWWLLRRQGCASELRIGIRKPAGGFEAHAWVQIGHAVLNEEEESHRHYAAFDSSFPAELAGRR